MTQWRDPRHAGAGSIEELGTVAAPTRVGSTRSGLIPAFIVGALLVGVVAVGVAGRTQDPRTPTPPLTAASASPAPPDAAFTMPADSPEGDEPLPPPSTQPAAPEPFPVHVAVEPWMPELRFSLVLRTDGEPLLRADLLAANGFRQTIPIESTWGDGVRVRLVGRFEGKRAVRLTDVPVPRVPDGSLDLPLELASGLVDAGALGLRDTRRRLADLHVELRLEAGRDGSTLLVAEVLPVLVSYDDGTAPDAYFDRAVADDTAREGLRRSLRCSRMLDPRIGRSEANLEGCAQVIGGVGSSR